METAAQNKMRIAYLTAGAAGMYCGSCLHDNALAKALIQLGHDAMLIPTYTPILTDEKNASGDQLFYGGINVYLQQASPIFRWLPSWADGFLSSPKLVGWIASKAMGTTADKLGAMTVSMLKGMDGRQKKEVQRLCDWLKTQAPDVVVFSNLLIAGSLPQVKKQIGCPAVVILQGDDIFYDGLEEPYREQALAELRRLAREADLFIVHSHDYGRRMQQLLGFSDEQLAVNPLSIDTTDFLDWEPPSADSVAQRPPTIGYLARLAPEKGLHILVDAFVELSQTLPDIELRIAGWLGSQHEDYWETQRQKLDSAGLADRYRYLGSVDRQQKLDFLKTIDVLSVPTPYQEPKGLFVLEGLAAGVPYIQPSHGAFPEIHGRLGGGHLCKPESATDLAERLRTALEDRIALRQLGLLGRQKLLAEASTKQEAEQFSEILNRLKKSRA